MLRFELIAFDFDLITFYYCLIGNATIVKGDSIAHVTACCTRMAIVITTIILDFVDHSFSRNQLIRESSEVTSERNRAKFHSTSGFINDEDAGVIGGNLRINLLDLSQDYYFHFTKIDQSCDVEG